MLGFLKKLFKKETKDDKDLFKFLDKADDAYMRAFETSDIRLFEPYASLPVLRHLQEAMKVEDTYFGLARYRKRSWTVVNIEQETYTLQKLLRHDNIHVTATVFVPLGEDLSEIWTVEYIRGKYTVTGIRRE